MLVQRCPCPALVHYVCPIASSKSAEKEENDFLPTIHPKTDEKMNDE